MTLKGILRRGVRSWGSFLCQRRYRGRLGRVALLEAMNDGVVVCSPSRRVTDAHIDLTLGAWYWSPRPVAHYRHTTILIGESDPRDRYELNEATDGVVELLPGVTLCHTEEFAGTTVPWLTATLSTRSTIGREGLPFHLSAGHGDPGFCSRWTLEVSNPWPVPVYIPVGSRVVSLHVDRVYGHDRLYTARYNATPETWQPTDMLPRVGNI